MQVTMTTDSGPVIRVGGKAISQISPACVVAEAACNHMSRMDDAVQLVDLGQFQHVVKIAAGCMGLQVNKEIHIFSLVLVER